MKIKIIHIFNLLLCVGIIIFLSFLARDYLVLKYTPLPDKIELPKDKQTLPEPVSKKDLSNYAVVLESGLFAPSGKLTLIDASTSNDVRHENPVERMVALIGTVVFPSKKSYAIFEEVSSKKQEIFKENEQVFGIGVLKDVAKDKAYIIAGNRKVSFDIPVYRGISLHVDGPVKNPVFVPPPPQTIMSQKIGEREWIIDQRALTKTLEDMGKVLTDARLLPYKEGDKVIGFSVSEIKSEGIFNLIGLRNGDILLRVNNYEIDSPEKGVQLLTGIKGESNVTLDIIRDGQKMNMRYQIR